LEEAYLLVHHCGFSYQDVMNMTFNERLSFSKQRVEESQRESEEIEKIRSK
jgi:hypothetical protein